MKKSIFLGLLLSLSGVLASDSDSGMIKDGKKLYKNGNTFVDSLQERAKKAPFKASSDEPGVCLFAGLESNPYRFHDCAGKTDDALKECCSKKSKADINASRVIRSFGEQPEWMNNNPTFTSSEAFWGN